MSEEDSKTIKRREFLKHGAAAGTGVVVGLNLPGQSAQEMGDIPNWDREVDVVVVGAGASGLPAAIRARDRGSDVIVIEENFDIGGHGIISLGNVALGGGTRIQKMWGIEDSADQVYLENTRPDHPHTRYADRNVVRAFADHNVEVFDFLEANGVEFDEDTRPMRVAAEGAVTPRRVWARVWSDDFRETINGTPGSGLMRALEKSARGKGVEILLQHRMIRFVREAPLRGRVLGVVVRNLQNDTVVNLRARQAVISCTGGSSSNVVVRTIYNPLLTEEYQVGCEPYTRQTGDSEQQGMAIGGSLGATNNMRTESYLALVKPQFLGARYGYAFWDPRSPVFESAGASGIPVADYQDLILVNMVGSRFYDETAHNTLSNMSGSDPVFDYLAAALSSAIIEVDGTKRRAGGPIWAIFDSDAVVREGWQPAHPHVDIANGFFFSADTLGELASKLKGNRYQKVPMAPSALEETVARYNSFVDMGEDPDFKKPAPKYKIQTPPFYAAWATPILHDTYTGLRVSAQFQVIDVFGHPIPGFYCAGEAAGGFALHGLGRALVGGYIAATNAVKEPRE